MANLLQTKEGKQPCSYKRRYLSPGERQQLNGFWEKCKNPTQKDYDDLAKLTDFPRKSIKRFFQNKRYRGKKDEESVDSRLSTSINQ